MYNLLKGFKKLWRACLCPGTGRRSLLVTAVTCPSASVTLYNTMPSMIDSCKPRKCSTAFGVLGHTLSHLHVHIPLLPCIAGHGHWQTMPTIHRTGRTPDSSKHIHVLKSLVLQTGWICVKRMIQMFSHPSLSVDS